MRRKYFGYGSDKNNHKSNTEYGNRLVYRSTDILSNHTSLKRIDLRCSWATRDPANLFSCLRNCRCRSRSPAVTCTTITAVAVTALSRHSQLAMSVFAHREICTILHILISSNRKLKFQVNNTLKCIYALRDSSMFIANPRTLLTIRYC